MSVRGREAHLKMLIQFVVWNIIQDTKWVHDLPEKTELRQNLGSSSANWICSIKSELRPGQSRSRCSGGHVRMDKSQSSDSG